MKKNCLVGLKYPSEISGIFGVGESTIEGVYRVLPCGGYEITERQSGRIVSSGTCGSEKLVCLIRQHPYKEAMLISVGDLMQIVKNGQNREVSHGS
jgi:hypothetical protein